MRYGKEKEIQIFKALGQKSALQVGLQFGFDKVYKDNRSIRNAVQSIYNKIKNNSEEYGVNQEIVEMVETSMAERKHAVVGSQEPSLAEKEEESLDFKEMVTNIRDKSFGLISKKLDMVSSSKKKLDALSFKELGVIAGIAFDKTQILKGEATEHIAVAAKISENITPEQAIEIALNNREATVEGNTKRG